MLAYFHSIFNIPNEFHLAHLTSQVCFHPFKALTERSAKHEVAGMEGKILVFCLKTGETALKWFFTRVLKMSTAISRKSYDIVWSAIKFTNPLFRLWGYLDQQHAMQRSTSSNNKTRKLATTHQKLKLCHCRGTATACWSKLPRTVLPKWYLIFVRTREDHCPLFPPYKPPYNQSTRIVKAKVIWCNLSTRLFLSHCLTCTWGSHRVRSHRQVPLPCVQ